jgi:large subunit ribosomal protein L30
MGKIVVTQVKSTIDRKENQKRTMIALGLGKIRKTVTHEDTPQIRGMIRTVNHLVTTEEIK